MARLNVYLPDELAAKARSQGLNLSALTQEAVTGVLRRRSTDAWLASLPRSSDEAVPHGGAAEALDAARDERTTRHG